MPNEIYEEIVEHAKKFNNNSSHIAFAYSFYYLVSWLYRYAKYIDMERFTIGKLKQILGYSEDNKTLNYVIKDGGVLDSIGYTKSDTDLPIYYTYTNEEKCLELTYISELKKTGFFTGIERHIDTNVRNRKIKVPFKGLFRERWAYEDNYLNGTFYEIENTHLITIDVFTESMANKEIGVIGFYLYSFLKFKNDKFPNGVNISLEQISSQTGIKPTVRDKYLEALKRYNFIDCIVKPFVVNMPKQYRKASRYRVNDVSDFSQVELEIEKRKVLNWEQVKTKYIEENEK
jgi:hypothetical protein